MQQEYPDSKIYVWNFWFIVVHQNKQQGVLKIYLSQELRDKEVFYRNLVGSIGISVPDILDIGTFSFSNSSFYFLSLSNIRHFQRFDEISEIDIDNLSEVISVLHAQTLSEKKVLLHWNLHQRNFFLTQTGKLWLFDFMSMRYGDREYDISLLYHNSDCDDRFLEKFLSRYVFINQISKEKLYKYTLLKVLENIKYGIWLEPYEIKKLKKNIIKLQAKINTFSA